MTQISFQLDIETKKIRKNQDSYGLKFIKKKIVMIHNLNKPPNWLLILLKHFGYVDNKVF